MHMISFIAIADHPKHALIAIIIKGERLGIILNLIKRHQKRASIKLRFIAYAPRVRSSAHKTRQNFDKCVGDRMVLMMV